MPCENYSKKNPCNNCPYRLDSPLAHWSVDEFKDLMSSENTQFGSVYGCHKKDGHVCVGWLKDQDNRNFPSIALRMSLSKNGVTRDYLDKIAVGISMYKGIKEMIKSNYPKLKI